MLDFLTVSTRMKKPGFTEIYPKFLIQKSEDLMIRGGDFYAVWVEDRGLWSTDENDVVQLVDRELNKYLEEHKGTIEGNVKVNYMWDAESGMIDSWHKYCQKQLRDSYHMLDEKLIFSNDGTNKKDYASKRLSYPLEAGECPAYEKIISTLYSEEERHKLEWAIGSIVSGESKNLQKFLVLYGGPGTGKSTILNIIQDLFDGYHAVFDAKALGSANAQFALEPFKKNPLVAIQHDGDLSKIEDNTRLNSVVSHEWMSVNEKHKSQYENRFICFLFMGTNKPVKITDGKSGILRRLIDVSPSGNKLNAREYKKLTKQVKFELGAIAYHCKEVFLADPGAYDDYIPTSMMGASNDFYNFMIDSYHVFRKEDGTTLKAAWEMYKTYVEEAKVPYSLSRMNFKSELMNYFRDYNERFVNEAGERARSYYSGFRTDKFIWDDERPKTKEKEETKTAADDKPVIPEWLKMDTMESIFDKECAKCLAQRASSKETPSKKWDDVTATLSKLDTSKLHYVKVPENHIVIDFDIKDDSGKKSFQKNLEAAKGWPPTYAELSKSGEGIHLHYIYSGDVSKLSRIYDDDIEIKVFTGKSSLRRMLTKCNNQPIATISSGLPLKGDDGSLVNWEGVKNEKMLRKMIKKNLNKEYHGATKPSVDYINSLLEEAYAKGIGYDVSDMKNDIFAFAAGSTNQADFCIKLVNKMKFKSEEPSPALDAPSDELVFYDVEVFPNLFLVNWKVAGEGRPVVRMINPSPSEIEELLHFNLVGFNCRRYDNHMLYACLMGYTNEQIYNLSQKIVTADKGSSHKYMFSEAYNISYTDVYDFAAKKQSLKKWEIELGIHHQELGLPWDQPVPKEMWTKVAEYCDNDVIATEAVFDHLKGDFTARQILADLAEGTVNDKTNTLTGKIIFGNERKPQGQFNWRNLAEPVYDLDEDIIEFLKEAAPEMMAERHGEAKSLLPYFPGYKYDRGKSTYKGVEVGEGGRVFAKPGMYGNVALLDVASMHPHSAIMEVLFGVKFTRRFREIVYGRVHIKHEAWEEVNNMLDGKLTPYIQKVINGEMSSKQLANALKIAINSVYGLTAASFETLFRDPRNIDNIVAKRGALFMVDLQEEVERRGFRVVHIKTDSIKIADATPEIIDFAMKFGKRYGYTFEHEETYDRMCLVNDAVYIAKYKTPHIDKDTGEEIWWTATGTQFQIPYVFKKLFSKEDIVFEDLCETKEVKTAIYLDMNEELPDVSVYEKELDRLRKDIRDAESRMNGSSNYEVEMRNTLSRVRELEELVSEGHDYNFVGKVGSFCPIKPGRGGGDLVREAKDAKGNVKYDSVTGAKGYRWLEAEAVKLLNKEADIDRSYYDDLVTAAVYGKGDGKNRKPGIADFGDFEWFVSEDPYIGPPFWDGRPLYYPLDENTPPWYTQAELEALNDDANDLFKRR